VVEVVVPLNLLSMEEAEDAANRDRQHHWVTCIK
jgi:hypothetical protein